MHDTREWFSCEAFNSEDFKEIIIVGSTEVTCYNGNGGIVESFDSNRGLLTVKKEGHDLSALVHLMDIKSYKIGFQKIEKKEPALGEFVQVILEDGSTAQIIYQGENSVPVTKIVPIVSWRVL